MRTIEDQAVEAVGRYYDAWKSMSGDFSGVPLADDLVFRGPVPVEPMTSAEILEVADGKIVRGELIYDAQELRAALAQAAEAANRESRRADSNRGPLHYER